MQRKIVFSTDEHYHIYNRGVDKRIVFTNDSDYQRFLLLLYLANSNTSVQLQKLIRNYSVQGRSLDEIFVRENLGESLVDVLAYCLMPNHVHLVLRERKEGGISKFMSKVMTGYSMYFNKKYNRTGTLWQGRFQANHIDEDSYLRHIFAYIHLNPIDLFQSGWKEDGLNDMESAIEFLNKYEYSSFHESFIGERPMSKIISGEDTLPWKDDMKSPERLFDFYEREL